MPVAPPVYRHRLPTRIWHWANAVTVFVMIGSGLTISNAHPHLYWGVYGANFDTPWFNPPHFPGWITIPTGYNLALARRWHLLFALVLGFNLAWFMAASLWNRHVVRDLRIRAAELRPAHVLADVRAHLAFRFHDAADPAAFNLLQKMAYAAALFVLLPVMIATGLALSPGWNAGAPWLLDLFGGRASARSIHFIACWAVIAFVVVHLVLVILAGPVREVRAMLTGVVAMIGRRTLLTGGAGALLAGCDRVQTWAPARKILTSGDTINLHLQRALIDRAALAVEYRPDQRSPVFRVNGTANPNTPAYDAMVADRFAGWRLQVGGLVARPLALSLAQLQSLPQRAQITRHDCVEGWSAIGQWRGPLLGTLLKLAGITPQARYLVFRCADRIGGLPYYESIDLIDAFHPQTILALQLNGQPLSVGHGAPARLRVERQLGYKQAKYVMAIEAVSSLAGIGKGKGGYWEDEVDYDWYAGI